MQIQVHHTFNSSISFRLVRGRPFHCISFLSFDIISIAMSTFRASYTLRLMFFSSYCCCSNKDLTTKKTQLYSSFIDKDHVYKHAAGIKYISQVRRIETWSGDAKLLLGSANSATSSSATWKVLATFRKRFWMIKKAVSNIWKRGWGCLWGQVVLYGRNKLKHIQNINSEKLNSSAQLYLCTHVYYRERENKLINNL